MQSEPVDPSQQGAIAVLVKTPDYSPIKTRLAQDVGNAAAAQFYALSCAAVASVLLQVKQQLNMQLYWAVAEPEAVRNPRWSQFQVCAQGTGGLGERMQQVFDTLLVKHRYVLLLGADAPQITLADFRQADTHLRTDSPQHVLAPAADGGFWCVGGNRAIPSEVWQETHYSGASTLRDFEALLTAKAFTKVAKLRRLTDIDTLADWRQARFELQHLQNPTPAQSALIELELIAQPNS